MAQSYSLVEGTGMGLDVEEQDPPKETLFPSSNNHRKLGMECQKTPTSIQYDQKSNQIVYFSLKKKKSNRFCSNNNKTIVVAY